MALLSIRRHRLERIEQRIERLGRHAGKLHEREQSAAELRRQWAERAVQSTGLRARRAARVQARHEQRIAKHVQRREQLVQREVRWIMLALQQQSERTRHRLDRELVRLTPVEQEWARLKGAFDALDETVAAPALEQLAGQWRGALKIPEFPVTECDGYPKPFPQQAVVF